MARCRSVSLARTVSDRCDSRPFHLFTLPRTRDHLGKGLHFRNDRSWRREADIRRSVGSKKRQKADQNVFSSSDLRRTAQRRTARRSRHDASSGRPAIRSRCASLPLSGRSPRNSRNRVDQPDDFPGCDKAEQPDDVQHPEASHDGYGEGPGMCCSIMRGIAHAEPAPESRQDNVQGGRFPPIVTALARATKRCGSMDAGAKCKRSRQQPTLTSAHASRHKATHRDTVIAPERPN